jgi:hypothetical protein
MSQFRVSLALLTLFSAASLAQTGITIPAGTPLPVKIDDKLPMKAGVHIRAELIYPVYVGDRLVLPARTVVTGKVISLEPDHARRVNARLRADFTPFHVPVVQFDHIQLADGTNLPLTTGTVNDGAPIYRLLAPPPHKGGFVSQQFAAFKQGVMDRLSVFTAPNKADRLTQLLWSQLPLHPERIAKDTAWTAETTAPLSLPGNAQSTSVTAVDPPASPATTEPSRTWILQAYLNTPISSATSKSGEVIRATVAEPVFNSDGSVAVPVGSVITGSVAQAKPARYFSRAGVLRFNFRQLKLPGEQPVAVQAALTGADSAAGGNLGMNSEGEVKPKAQDKIIVPLLLIALAGRPLDRDHHEDVGVGKNAVASNSLGIIGFIVGTAAQQPNLAAGIGYYGAAISIYQRIFSRGKEVAFTRDTRIVLQTTPRRSAAIKPDSTRP